LSRQDREYLEDLEFLSIVVSAQMVWRFFQQGLGLWRGLIAVTTVNLSVLELCWFAQCC